jgi:outer membrane protein TolC
VQLEQPIGNRAAEAAYSQRRMERQQAIISFRNTIQGIESEVIAALQDIQRGYERIEQRGSARVAAAEDLRQLQVEEETLQSITPEFLNLKLQRQQSLAAAEQQEITAVVLYNTAVARYYAATGTALSRNQIQFDVPSLIPEARTSELFPDWPTEKQRERELRRGK